MKGTIAVVLFLTVFTVVGFRATEDRTPKAQALASTTCAKITNTCAKAVASSFAAEVGNDNIVCEVVTKAQNQYAESFSFAAMQCYDKERPWKGESEVFVNHQNGTWTSPYYITPDNKKHNMPISGRVDV